MGGGGVGVDSVVRVGGSMVAFPPVDGSSWSAPFPLADTPGFPDANTCMMIDARGRLTAQQVEERLRAEIDRERSSGVQYWALFDHRNGDFVGCGGLRPWIYTPGERNFELGFHLVKRSWGKGLATEAALGALDYAWQKLRLSKVYAGHHPDNRASQRILKKLGFEFVGDIFYEPTGLMHPSYCKTT